MQTERKLIDAVDFIVKNNGLEGLGVNKVAKQAGVSKILIYRYFGNFEKLLKTCVEEKDFWTNHLADSPVVNSKSKPLQILVMEILNEQFSHFYNHCEMEANILNSIVTDCRIPKNLSNNRKYQGDQLSPAHEMLKDSADYYHIISRLLVAGTQELFLQSIQKRVGGNKVHTVLQKDDLLRSMERILHTAFN